MNHVLLAPAITSASSHHSFLQVLQLEAHAIARTADQLEASCIDRAIALLQDCLGKVVLTGMGKSGLVARKIAATFTSTGTTAVFLHPSDALHGDVGIANAEDVVIAISNSGETDEILAILPTFKQRKIPVIAIVGNPASTLGRQAAVVLEAGVDREACPLNLAPTTSTTVALAIGDALAATVMQLKGLTPEDFALNHPAGRLGKRLTLTVADLMHSGTANPVIPASAAWLEVIEGITAGGLGAINVVDEQGRLMGIITDGDVRRALRQIVTLQGSDHGLIGQSMMSANPIATTADQLAYDALQLMENRTSQISVLPVIDDDRVCIGMIRLHDIIRSGLA